MHSRRGKQTRAIETERKFLEALEACLRTKSFQQTTIDHISEAAGLHRAAFLKRFGTKKNALFLLYETYCSKTLAALERIRAELDHCTDAEAVFTDMSSTLHSLLLDHLASNRAMHEHFMENLETDAQTKRIFKATVELVHDVQRQLLGRNPSAIADAFAATQLLTTINYNYALKAMPALYADDNKRHRLIARAMLVALSD